MKKRITKTQLLKKLTKKYNDLMDDADSTRNEKKVNQELLQFQNGRLVSFIEIMGIIEDHRI